MRPRSSCVFELGLTSPCPPSVDLFARESNERAISLYESLGYVVFRRVVGYYGGGPRQADEDGLGTLSV